MTWMSVRQSPAAPTRTMTSSGPSTLGSSISSTVKLSGGMLSSYRCNRDNLVLEATVRSALGAREAMRGRFDEARDEYARAKAIYHELGLMVALGGLAKIGAELELLAGDPVAAER